MPDAKIALITGSGKKRVGFTVAEELAKKGFHIAVHYRSSATEALETVGTLRSLGVQAEAYPADLRNETEIKAMIDSVIRDFGRIDVLVNTAAIWPRVSLEQTTAQTVRENFETNTLGTFLCCQQVGLQMVRQPSGGVIINFGDWACERPYLDFAAYFPSKGAIPTLTRTFAAELGTRNPRVRVNCILPGPVMLPPELSVEEKSQVIQATLVKREGTPQHIASAVTFLIENDFITGVSLPVDGGRTIYAPD